MADLPKQGRELIERIFRIYNYFLNHYTAWVHTCHHVTSSQPWAGCEWEGGQGGRRRAGRAADQTGLRTGRNRAIRFQKPTTSRSTTRNKIYDIIVGIARRTTAKASASTSGGVLLQIQRGINQSPPYLNFSSLFKSFGQFVEYHNLYNH